MLLRCQTENTETVELTDILSTSSHYAEEQDKVITPQKLYESTIPLSSFHKIGGFMIDSIVGFEEIHFLDRFSPEESDKFSVWKDGKSTEVYVYTFKKGKANNAFINWLNCFGKTCDQISLLDDQYITKDRMTIWSNDQTIIFINKPLTNLKEQEQWLNSFRLEFGLKWKYQLVLQKGKPIIWTQDIELKEI